MVNPWLQSWDVQARAVAIKYIPDCLKDGLIARGLVDISSNNGFVNKICIHGKKGVHMQNHTYYEPGVNVSIISLTKSACFLRSKSSRMISLPCRKCSNDFWYSPCSS